MRAFRSLKSNLEIRPIHHRLEKRVRAHVFLCMLAYYLEWHLCEAWTELIFKDECPPSMENPVAPALRSKSAAKKARTKRTTRGEPCHSFSTLIDELALKTSNTIRIPGTEATFDKETDPNPLQARALELIELAPKVV